IVMRNPAAPPPLAEPTPTPDATVAPVAAPEAPPEAGEHTEAGGLAFLQYWFSTLSYAAQTGDLAPVSAATSPECGDCQAAMTRIEAAHAAGGGFRGGAYVVRGVTAASLWSADQPVYDATIDRTHRVELDAAGATVDTLPALPFTTCTVVLEWSGGQWRVRALISPGCVGWGPRPGGLAGSAPPAAPPRPRTGARSPVAQGRVQLLQRADGHVTPQQCLDTHHRRGRARHRGGARDVRGHRRAADLVPVLAGVGPGPLRSIDHQRYLAVRDDRDRVVAVALEVLGYQFAVDPVPAQHLPGAHGSDDLETEVGQPLHREDHASLVPVRHSDQNLSRHRQRSVRRRLRL